MKVYVDKLPECCDNCPCRNQDVDYGSCCNLGAYENYDYFCINKKHPRCPLQSIADYTKQVRKEVCEELKEEIRKWCKENFDYKKLPNELGCWVAVNREEFFKLLDQIQGEDNG